MRDIISAYRGLAMCGVITALALGTPAFAASMPSTPAERAATAELNRQIIADNNANEERARALEMQYDEQVREVEAAERRMQQYQNELRAYESKIAP